MLLIISRGVQIVQDLTGLFFYHVFFLLLLLSISLYEYVLLFFECPKD